MQFQIYLGFFGLVQGCRGLVDIVDWRICEVEKEGEEAISQVILVMLLFPNLTRCMLTNLSILYKYLSSRIFCEELLEVTSLLWLSVDFELLSQSLEGALHF